VEARLHREPSKTAEGQRKEAGEKDSQFRRLVHDGDYVVKGAVERVWKVYRLK